jgi:prolyl-tRNA synthetase
MELWWQKRYFDKEVKPKDGIATYISDLLGQIQEDLFNKLQDSHITEVNSFEEFKAVLNDKGFCISTLGWNWWLPKRR